MYQIVHMHRNICRHTHAVDTSFYSNVFFTVNKSVQRMHSTTIYMGLKKMTYKKTVN